MTIKKQPLSAPTNALSRIAVIVGLFILAPLALQSSQAHAGAGSISLATDPLTLKECSDCHPAYSPRYLRAYAWQRIMGNLQNHFGEDARLDKDIRKKIERYYLYNASRPRKIGIRITDKKWFRHEHNAKKFSPQVMAKVVSFSNCTGCHSVKKRKKAKK